MGIVLKINDRIKVRAISFFNDVKLNLKHDSIASTFECSFFFDPSNHNLEELACVSHYHEAIIEYDGILVLTGYVISQGFKSSPVSNLATIVGASKTAFLAHCTMPINLFPVQFNGLSLVNICNKILPSFNLSLSLDYDLNQTSSIQFINKANPDTPNPQANPSDYTTYIRQRNSFIKKVNSPIKETTAEVTSTVEEYIVSLASQRNILVSHDANGNLLLTESKSNNPPVIHFTKGMIGVEMQLTFSGDALHSDITVVAQADTDTNIQSQFTVQNPYVPIVYRPLTIVATSHDDDTVNIQEAAYNALAAELKNIRLTITVDRWMINGIFITPNNIISVENDDLYLYKRCNWFVEEVDYEVNHERETATLTCVLPEVYNNNYPKNIFVDAHENSATGYTINI